MTTWVSWCDDGVTVVCDLPRCMVGGYWWQEVVSPPPGAGFLVPKDLARAISAHEMTHKQEAKPCE